MGEVAVSSEEVAAGMELEIGKEKDWKKKKKNKDEEEGEDNNTEGEEGSSSSVVRWEKFLPRMVLRVLLVEADDSTRQIIAALLRKCSYRVAAVPDGLMAWETLKGKPHNIDLILTEVELPSISGYALLTLVMEHEICKNIPVIMMSSQDSISMVLKCMVKGAADFLIKPVRRNELRNLWQHVWRRQSPNAGNIPQNSPMIPRKVEATSENNAASNHSSGFAMSFTRTKECRQKESDAQGISQLKCVSSSNMSSVESQKYKGCSEIDKRSITPDSISGERSKKLATSYNDAYDATALKQGGESPCMKALQDQNATLESDRANTNVHHNHIDDVVEPFNGAIGLIGAFDSSEKHMSGNYCLNDGPNRLEFTPQLELSLRRCYRTCSQNQGGEERQALNHSNASAFSRYNSKTLQPFFSTSSNSCLDIKDDTAKSPKLSSDQLSENKNGACQQHAVTSSHNQEILSTLVIAQSAQGVLAYPSPQIGLISVPGVRLDNFSTGYGHVLPPLYYAQASLAPSWSPKVPSKRENSPFPTSTSIHSNPENINAKENCKFSDETTNDSVDINRHQQDNLEPAEEQHVSPAMDWSTINSLCNGFGDHRSSHVYGSLCSTNDGNATLDVAAEKCATPESLNNGGLFIRGVGVTDTQRMSQREAALTKFLLKRKERCFEKKVRYQSRKRLAEQRPRVKGQFVRQTPMTDANA